MKQGVRSILVLCLCMSMLIACGGKNEAEISAAKESFNNVQGRYYDKRLELYDAFASAVNEQREIDHELRGDLDTFFSKKPDPYSFAIRDRADIDEINSMIDDMTLYTEEATRLLDELKSSSMPEDNDVEIQGNEKNEESYPGEDAQRINDAPKQENVSGIIVIRQETFGNTYVDCIDPETGQSRNIRTFPFKQESREWPSPAWHRNDRRERSCGFNSDLSLIVAEKNLVDEVHIGWMDSDGKFTDVSERITTKSDFGSLVNHGSPKFWRDYLYYVDWTDSVICRVPIDNLTPNAVEIMSNKANNSYYINPDGSIENGYRAYSDESMTLFAKQTSVFDWLSHDSYIGCPSSSYTSIGIFEIVDVGGVYECDAELRLALVPEIKDRKSWNAMISPDGSKVVFLSSLGNRSPEMFCVPIDGGEPVKINTDYSFDSWGSHSSYGIMLYDWR